MSIRGFRRKDDNLYGSLESFRALIYKPSLKHELMAILLSPSLNTICFEMINTGFASTKI
jgi:hypothetical protein